MSKLESAAKHSSDLLNKVIDHVHLTGEDYAMALQATEARDGIVKLAALEEVEQAWAVERDSHDEGDNVRAVLDRLKAKYTAEGGST